MRPLPKIELWDRLAHMNVGAGSLESLQRWTCRLVVCLAVCVSMANQALAQHEGTASAQAPIQPGHDAPSAIVFAAGLGLGFGLGHLYATPNNSVASPLPTWLDPTVEGNVSKQVPFSLGVAYRPVPLLSFGLAAELARVFPAHCSSQCNGGALSLGAELRFHFRTGYLLSPWTALGFGYELLHFDNDQGSATLDGYGIDLRAGSDLHAGHNWTYGPYVELHVGTYTHISSYGAFRGASRESIDVSDADRAIHEWVTFGVRGTFSLSLGESPHQR